MTISTGEIVDSWSIYWLTYVFVGSILTYLNGERMEYLDKDIKFGRTVTINFATTLVGSHIFGSIIPSLRIYKYIGIILSYVICTVISDAWFYYSHRLMHRKGLFKLIHSKHHKLDYPFALYAIYSSWQEVLLISIPSASIGPLLCGIDGIYLHIWMMVAAINTVVTHSGIAFLSSFHDIHHRKYKKNFGVLGLFDYMNGTYVSH